MKKLIIFLVAMSSAQAFADDLQLGYPASGGSGCPQGSVSAVLSPDRKTLSVLFDQYLVEAGRNVGRNVDRKSCNLAIPVHVPNGYSISLFKVDYRGFNSIPSGAMSRLNVNYFFAGSQGQNYNKTFYGPVTNNYFLSSNVVGSTLVWSPCGMDTNLRINSDLLVSTNQYGEQTMSTVDSTDIKSGLIYYIQMRRCQ